MTSRRCGFSVSFNLSIFQCQLMSDSFSGVVKLPATNAADGLAKRDAKRSTSYFCTESTQRIPGKMLAREYIYQEPVPKYLNMQMKAKRSINKHPSMNPKSISTNAHSIMVKTKSKEIKQKKDVFIDHHQRPPQSSHPAARSN